jgi:hypothetical protein
MDNERPIEKLLRRYAKKRRDDPAAAGLELHPATRRLLQGEVSRQFPKPAAGDANSVPGLRSLWPRLAWALPVVLVLGVGVWLIVEPRQPGRDAVNLAKMENAPMAQPHESLAPVGTPAQPVGGAAPSNENVRGALAYAETSLPKDNAGARGLAGEKLKTERAPAARALNPAAPGIVTPAPQVAAQDKAIPEKALADRDARERLGRDTRAEEARMLTLSEPRAPAEEPVASTARPMEVARALPATRSDRFGVPAARGVEGETAGLNRAGTPLSATPPPAAAPALSLAASSLPAQAEYGRAQLAPATIVQKFVQTTAFATSGGPARKNAETPPVLETFQVEQTGNQLRVIDSDGSSYSGSIQFAKAEAFHDAVDETKKTGDFMPQAKIPAPKTFRRQIPEPQAGENYFFRVAGTNRTLKQTVAFTGNLLVLTNASPATQYGVTLAPAGKSHDAQAQSGLPILLNSSISGKVQLGADKEMQINAVPVPP